MKSLKQWWLRVRGLDYPAPVVGQRWKSLHSGRIMTVEAIDISDIGQMFITVTQPPLDACYPAMPFSYATGLAEWRRDLSRERRVLVPKDAT